MRSEPIRVRSSRESRFRTRPAIRRRTRRLGHSRISAEQLSRRGTGLGHQTPDSVRRQALPRRPLRENTAAVGQGPHAAEKTTRYRRERTRPPWDRGPTLRRRQQDIAGREHGRRGTGAPRCGEDRGPTLRRRRQDIAGREHGRRGTGAPRCGGDDEMSPGISTAGYRHTTTRRR